MKAKITIIASFTIASLLFSVYQPGNAITYYNHEWFSGRIPYKN